MQRKTVTNIFEKNWKKISENLWHAASITYSDFLSLYNVRKS